MTPTKYFTIMIKLLLRIVYSMIIAYGSCIYVDDWITSPGYTLIIKLTNENCLSYKNSINNSY